MQNKAKLSGASLRAIFESPAADADFPEPELEQKTAKQAKSDLTKALKAVGIDAGDRLVYCCGTLKLRTTDVAQHKSDEQILFDLTKISPIIDAGFAVIDADNDGEHWNIHFIGSNAEADPDFEDLPEPDSAEPLKVEARNKKAAEIVERLISRTRGQ